MHAFSKRPSDLFVPSACHLIFKYRASKTQKNFFRAAYKFLNFCRALLTVNISEMADKEKRFRKILLNINLKGKLKMVKTLEEARLVLLKKIGLGTFRLIRKEDYLELIERGYTFPEEEVYFTVSSNPRDSKHIEERYLTNAFSNITRVSQ